MIENFAKFIFYFLGWLTLVALSMGIMSIRPKPGLFVPRLIFIVQVILLFTVAGLAFIFSVSVFLSLKSEGVLIIGGVYTFWGMIAFLGSLKKAIKGENPFPKQTQVPDK